MMLICRCSSVILVLVLVISSCKALKLGGGGDALSSSQTSRSSRRSFLIKQSSGVAAALILGTTATASPVIAAESANLNDFTTSKSGLQFVDAKVGTGPEPKSGQTIAIDYVMSTTGARYGSKIYATNDKGSPYRFTLGDGSTIAGLEQAILGSSPDIPAMRPGGIRRVIIPQTLAYERLGLKANQCETIGLGPIPPLPDAFEEYQRFKNIYCNPNRAYQPDVVMDIKLYGKRTID
mmetsp:Transcript_42277/g.62686  ORF Transcript_42277/g.62686 Transcript_42277/m.62686 type:complete len:236 (-) Transcript_42277:51-758(-)|eukprot:CAMPEP_0194040630 /NCGR_PEP_ID=MMETSP0009_2-20130614/12596_1 /TAXON_ID=210454 /ORGANISM="Grammatophora oceanica, Strain CCMP 410" /LENGTH=235 /DNA_ID=CAMNT_0038683823 /DNA_START=49 /DNA_END=756 /DNA_ORIENTATION=-